MNKNKAAQELGRKGSDKRWATRYELLEKLAGHTDKTIQNKILKWPTKALEILLAVYEDKNEKLNK